MQMFRFKEKEIFHVLLVIGRIFCRRIVFYSNYFFSLSSVSDSREEEDKHFAVVVDSFVGKLLKVKVRLS